jgi:hypothetical protein
MIGETDKGDFPFHRFPVLTAFSGLLTQKSDEITECFAAFDDINEGHGSLSVR